MYKSPAVGSSVAVLQTDPPPTRTPFGQLSAPGSAPVGARENVHRVRPVFASSAAMMHAHARSAPIVPMNTRPFQTMGAAEIAAGAASASDSLVIQTSEPSDRL